VAGVGGVRAVLRRSRRATGNVAPLARAPARPPMEPMGSSPIVVGCTALANTPTDPWPPAWLMGSDHTGS
jgi:hypothetical protein